MSSFRRNITRARTVAEIRAAKLAAREAGVSEAAIAKAEAQNPLVQGRAPKAPAPAPKAPAKRQAKRPNPGCVPLQQPAVAFEPRVARAFERLEQALAPKAPANPAEFSAFLREVRSPVQLPAGGWSRRRVQVEVAGASLAKVAELVWTPARARRNGQPGTTHDAQLVTWRAGAEVPVSPVFTLSPERLARCFAGSPTQVRLNDGRMATVTLA